jgi:predicted RNase H-like HicB family nuclease
LPTNPQEIEEILKNLDEKPENAMSVIAECSKNHVAAWLYNINVFQDARRTNMSVANHEELKVRKLKINDFDVCLTEEDEGGFSIECLSLRGCISQGETEEEAIKNIKDAMKSYLEAAKKYGISTGR